MRESFLHFVWQFQKFNKLKLTTADGQPVKIFTVGNPNINAGPDFLNAKLLVGELIWHGHVEIHLKSSDWDRHGHQNDEAYNNVVLHVVWEHDLEVRANLGQTLIVLELFDRVSEDLLNKYGQLIKSPEEIPCASQLSRVKHINKLAMLDRSGIERLMQKSLVVLHQLDKNNGDWEETTYQMLAKNFGFKINEHPFLKLSELVSHKWLVKHSRNPKEIEALLFGMAGFLYATYDSYHAELKKEFDYLSRKYGINDLSMWKAEWKYLRLRPRNFPTIRLAQFSAFIRKNAKCFDRFIHYSELTELMNLFEFNVSSYWSRHYDFAKTGNLKTKGMGRSSIDLILINTVAPLLAAYAQYTGNEIFMQKAVFLLQSLEPEENKITRQWEALGLTAKDAFDTQALIGLKNEFCLKKKCLSCKIGVSLING